MKAYTIRVDGIPYGGIDPDGNEPARPQLGSGFHRYGSGAGRDALLWGGEPHVIESAINLQSHLGRILDRMRDGSLVAHEIVIREVR